MHDEESFRALEARLRDEASRLKPDSPGESLIADWRRTFVRRRRRRIAIRSVGATALIVAAALIGSHWTPLRQHETEKSLGSLDRQMTAVHPNEQETPPHEKAPPYAQNGPAQAGPKVVAVGILISRPGKDGKPEMVPGLYVPARVESMNSQELTPAERVAVSHLLGTDFEVSDDHTI